MASGTRNVPHCSLPHADHTHETTVARDGAASVPHLTREG
jgi:hypothetical protein